MYKSHDNKLMSFAVDAKRFISFFIKPISKSIPHIYLTALPFSPTKSMVANNYKHLFPRTFSVQLGKSTDYPPELIQLEGHSQAVTSVVFSPDGRRIVSGSGDKTVRVWDAELGKLISSPFAGH